MKRTEMDLAGNLIQIGLIFEIFTYETNSLFNSLKSCIPKK